MLVYVLESYTTQLIHLLSAERGDSQLFLTMNIIQGRDRNHSSKLNRTHLQDCGVHEKRTPWYPLWPPDVVWTLQPLQLSGGDVPEQVALHSKISLLSIMIQTTHADVANQETAHWWPREILEQTYTNIKSKGKHLITKWRKENKHAAVWDIEKALNRPQQSPFTCTCYLLIHSRLWLAASPLSALTGTFIIY